MENQFIENLASNILLHFPVAVYTTDSIGLLTFYNEPAEILWGRKPRLKDPQETAFCGSWKLFTLDGTPLPHNRSPMAMALKYRKSPGQSEICIQRPDGTKATVVTNISPLFRENGQLAGAINVLYDITRYKQPDILPRLAALVESSTDAIIGKNLEGVINSWNKGATKIFGYEEHEAIGQNIRFIIPENKQDEEDMIMDKIRKGEHLRSFETIRIGKGNKPVAVSVNISPIKDFQGRIIGASKIARDISPLIEAREKLKHYAEELKRINASKDDFIAMTSHELKTPLAILKANLQFLESQISPDSEWRELIQKSLNQEERLNVIVSNLIDISKMEAGKFSFVFSTFDVQEFLDECIDNLLLVKKTHQIIRRYTLAGVKLFADRIRIGQVLNNLLSNAIKYSPTEKPILVNGYLETENLIISVSDSGPGIADSEIKKIFDIFFRSEETRLIPGLGVGLYLSKQIVAAHQGKLWVESESNKGSTFFIGLPVTKTGAR